MGEHELPLHRGSAREVPRNEAAKRDQRSGRDKKVGRRRPRGEPVGSFAHQLPLAAGSIPERFVRRSLMNQYTTSWYAATWSAVYGLRTSSTT